MPEERRPYSEAHCRDCQCAEHNTMTALAERRDAWVIANNLLTQAVKAWPKGDEDPVTIDAADVLLAANWLYYGETSVGT
jgi:hypothetical protein